MILISHIIALIFSWGYIHPDEHFQILEFLGYKLGITPESSLPWEYTAKMRPWIQPALFYLIVSPFYKLGIQSPFFALVLLKIIGIAIHLACQYVFIKEGKNYFSDEKDKYFFTLASLSIWFLPLLHLRLSSESWATSFLMLGIGLLFQKDKQYSFLIGVIFGISFLCRYHVAFIVAPLITILWITKVINIRYFLFTIFGVFFTLLIGTIIDYWGYGSLTFAPWEYVKQNIYYNKAANYGISPWYEYLKKVFSKGIPPISIIYILSFLLLWIKKPKSSIAISSFCFFFVHTLIGHKEWRFLFPMVAILPFALTVSFSYFLSSKKTVKLYLMISVILMIGSSFISQFPSYDLFFKTRNLKIDKIYYTTNENPYNYHQLNQHFFVDSSKIEQIKIESISDIKESSFTLFNNSLQLSQELIRANNCDVLYSEYPNIIRKLIYKLKPTKKTWMLLKCSK